MAPPCLVGIHMSNNQQQLATQEFLTSRGSLYTRYLSVFMQIYIYAFYELNQTLWYVRLIEGCWPHTELLGQPQPCS